MHESYSQLLDYLASLGTRHAEIGRAEITYDGQGSGKTAYPLVLVEGDALRDELTPGLDRYSLAIQVLTQSARQGQETPAVLLARCAVWVDEILQQLRDEMPGALDGQPSAVAFVGNAGSDLATGWRVELRLKLPKPALNRQTNAAKFRPLT